MTWLLKAGDRLISRLVPKADADACGYVTAYCYCSWNDRYVRDCMYCADGSYACGSCYNSYAWCS